ncbi:MAG: hypothetical protein WCK21_07285 [Actinomycetota bacterium]
MAVAARSERAAAVRARVHGGGVADARAMVKRTAPLAEPPPRSRLVVVPRRKRTARLIAAASVVVFGLMLGAAAFQTQIARRQLTLDTLDRDIRAGRSQFEVLRRERAELRSPGRLAEQASALGMEAATQTQFVSLQPDEMAIVQRTGASATKHAATPIQQEFEQYADVKAQALGAP